MKYRQLGHYLKLIIKYLSVILGKKIPMDKMYKTTVDLYIKNKLKLSDFSQAKRKHGVAAITSLVLPGK